MSMMLRRRVTERKGGIDYSQEFLTFTAVEDTTFTLTIPVGIVGRGVVSSISYSTDGGNTWIDSVYSGEGDWVTTTPTIMAGESVRWKNVVTYYTYLNNVSLGNSTFSSTGKFDMSGNILSIIYGENFYNKNSVKLGAFCYLFKDSLVCDCGNLYINISNIVEQVFRSTFYRCQYLYRTPIIYADRVTGWLALGEMFRYCPLVNFAKITATSYTGKGLYSWLHNCAATGVIEAPIDITSINNAVPSGWVVRIIN